MLGVSTCLTVQVNRISKTVDMSGFEKMGDKIGYGYEAVCQRALWEGIDYLSKCDRPENILDKSSGFKNDSHNRARPKCGSSCVGCIFENVKAGYGEDGFYWDGMGVCCSQCDWELELRSANS